VWRAALDLSIELDPWAEGARDKAGDNDEAKAEAQLLFALDGERRHDRW
jgi:hypothetical protein